VKSLRVDEVDVPMRESAASSVLIRDQAATPLTKRPHEF
jgi:hypothetical protein